LFPCLLFFSVFTVVSVFPYNAFTHGEGVAGKHAPLDEQRPQLSYRKGASYEKLPCALSLRQAILSYLSARLLPLSAFCIERVLFFLFVNLNCRLAHSFRPIFDRFKFFVKSIYIRFC
jgi:hypothetical protein